MMSSSRKNCSAMLCIFNRTVPEISSCLKLWDTILRADEHLNPRILADFNSVHGKLMLKSVKLDTISEFSLMRAISSRLENHERRGSSWMSNMPDRNVKCFRDGRRP